MLRPSGFTGYSGLLLCCSFFLFLLLEEIEMERIQDSVELTNTRNRKRARDSDSNFAYEPPNLNGNGKRRTRVRKFKRHRQHPNGINERLEKHEETHEVTATNADDSEEMPRPRKRARVAKNGNSSKTVKHVAIGLGILGALAGSFVTGHAKGTVDQMQIQQGQFGMGPYLAPPPPVFVPTGPFLPGPFGFGF